MFGWFKKKKTRTGYKIVPFLDKGFHVEKHDVHGHVYTYSINVLGKSIRDDDWCKCEDGFIGGRGYSFQYKGDNKLFESKECARKFIDSIIANENQKKAEANEQKGKSERFFRENPPEWYP